MRNLLAACAAALLWCVPAQADPYAFSVSYNFAPDAPITNVTGDFILDFDGSLVTPGTSDGLTIANFTFPYEGEAKFAASVSVAGAFILIGNDIEIIGPGAGACHLDLSIRSFCATIVMTETGQFISEGMRYTWDGVIYDTPNGGNPPTFPGVPEPAVWAMLIGGFGLAGASLRRRANTVTYSPIA